MHPSICSPVYTLHVPKYWQLNDRPAENNEKDVHASLLFHIRQNDYFSTLATILRFYEESISSAGTTTLEMRKLQLKTLKGVIQDLLHLDKNYAIFPKDKGANKNK